MDTIDWSKAPKWATVRLQHVSSPGTYAWASQYQECAVAKLDTDYGINFPLVKDMWVVITTRPAEHTTWDGTGLPPVGTVCEVRMDRTNWRRCEVFAHKQEQDEIDVLYSHTRGDGKPGWSWGRSSEAFRPLRTPEQIAAEEREKALDAMVTDSGWAAPITRLQAAELYDTGYRKVEAAE